MQAASELLRLVAVHLADELGIKDSPAGLMCLPGSSLKLRLELVGDRAMVRLEGRGPCVQFVEVRDARQAAMIPRWVDLVLTAEGRSACASHEPAASRRPIASPNGAQSPGS